MTCSFKFPYYKTNAHQLLFHFGSVVLFHLDKPLAQEPIYSYNEFVWLQFFLVPIIIVWVLLSKICCRVSFCLELQVPKSLWLAATSYTVYHIVGFKSDLLFLVPLRISNPPSLVCLQGAACYLWLAKVFDLMKT